MKKITEYISSFSGVVIKYHNQNQLKEEFMLAYSFRRLLGKKVPESGERTWHASQSRNLADHICSRYKKTERTGSRMS